MAIGRHATPLISLDAVALDTETTGLDPRQARIVEIAGVRLVCGQPDEQQSIRRLVNPGAPIPPAASRIHGIDDGAVQGVPAFDEVWPEVRAWIGDAVLVGHNISFDIAVLERECRRAGLEPDAPVALCTRLLSQAAAPALPDYSLEGIAAWLNIPVEGRHSARGDAVTAARIFAALVPKLRERGVRTVAEALRASAALTEIVEKQVGAGWSEPARIAGGDDGAARRDVYPYRHRVGAIMSAPVATILPDTPLEAALDQMVRRRISSLFVPPLEGPPRPENTGIVTERDVLRALHAGGAAALSTPVREVMSRPLVAVAEDALAFAAISRMNRLKIRHLGVTDPRGEIVGALSARDLLRLRAEGAAELGDEIGQARDVPELGRAWAKLAQVSAELVREGLSGREVAAVVSQRVRDMMQHAAELAQAAMREAGQGGPPARYAFFVLGSAGRDESLLAMDQDNALVYADDAPPEADAWFEEFSARAADILHQVGIPLCKGGVMAKNPQWRGSQSAWRERIDGWIRNADPQSLLSVDIFFDLRHADGDPALTEMLRRYAFDAARGQTVFAKLLIESAGFAPTGLGWLGAVRTEQGRIDLKKTGLFGIVSTARALAICHHITARSTPERLAGLIALGLGLEPDLDALSEAQGVFLDLILRQQIDDIRNGHPASNAVEVKMLSRRDRERLRAALRSVEHLDEIARTLLFKD